MAGRLRKTGGKFSKNGGVCSGNRGAFFGQFAKLRIVSSRFLLLPSAHQRKESAQAWALERKVAGLGKKECRVWQERMAGLAYEKRYV